MHVLVSEETPVLLTTLIILRNRSIVHPYQIPHALRLVRTNVGEDSETVSLNMLHEERVVLIGCHNTQRRKLFAMPSEMLLYIWQPGANTQVAKSFNPQPASRPAATKARGEL